MTIFLYIETNCIMGMAKGREPLVTSFLQDLPQNVNILLPSVCYFEALVALENERKRYNNFIAAIDIEINEAQRNLVSQQAQILSDSLEQSLVDYDILTQEFNYTFLDILSLLEDKIELIHPNRDTLEATLQSEFLNQNKELRDNFILRCIINHCQENQNTNKVFFSRNSKQFNKSEIQAILLQINLKYFADFENVINWIKTQ